MDRPRLPESVVTPPTSPEAKPSGVLRRLPGAFVSRVQAIADMLRSPARPSSLGEPDPHVRRISRRRGFEAGATALTAVGMALGAGARPVRAEDGTSGTGTTAEPPTSNGPDSGVAGIQDGVAETVKAPLREVSFLEAPKTVYGNIAQDGYTAWSMGNTKLHVTDEAVASDIFQRRMLAQGKGVQVVMFDDIKQIPAEFDPKVRISRAVVIGDEAMEISGYAFADGIGVIDGVTVRVFAPVDPLDKQLAVLGSSRTAMTVKEAFESDVSFQIGARIWRLYPDWDQMTDEEKAPILKDMAAVNAGLFQIG